MHVGYCVLDLGLCMMECVCFATSHIYIATDILTRVHAAMCVKDIPNDLINCCRFQLWCCLGAIQLKVYIQSRFGAHQDK